MSIAKSSNQVHNKCMHFDEANLLFTALKLTRLLYLQGIAIYKLEMWANAQRDGRPAEYRWRPLFNAAKFG